ncbi:MAG: sulfatase-like hydrolase/transferase [SAR324 cluster bacterium]|nr:sulfatase-like hydrolase/transferase [SAR324 cluster bacterium]
MSNVVILMADEHNPLYSSVYKHPFVMTPNMEKLAKRGTVFENAYCPSPLCLPSRSSFITGKRVHQLQTYNNCMVNLDTSPQSYGSFLDQQGVHTVHIGKTHFFDQGEKLGYSEMILPGEAVYPGNSYIQRNPLPVRNEVLKRATSYGAKENDQQLLNDLDSIDSALDWIRNNGNQQSKPWVLAVNLVKPHFPHFTTEEMWEMYASHEDLPLYPKKCKTAQHPYAKAHRKYFQVDSFTEEQVKGLRRGYYGCVSFVDQQLGKLMAVLDSEGLQDETNLIYAADHGEMLGKFGMWWKCNLYEDAVRIPCIAAGPDFQSDFSVETPVDLHDVQASIFEAVGVQHPDDWLGTPLSQIPQNDQDRIIFSEYHGHGAPGSLFMVRKGNWKYIHYSNAPHQLFDLKEDPDELNNLLEHRYDLADAMLNELLKVCDAEEEHQRAETFIMAQLEKLNLPGS